MTRFISVCIFCFICATHSPCASHAAVGHEIPQPFQKQNDLSNPPFLEHLQTPPNDSPLPPLGGHRDDSNFKIYERHESDNVNNDSVQDSDHQDVATKIFSKYGNGDSMNVESFREMMSCLNMLHLVTRKLEADERDESVPVSNSKRSINTTMPNSDMCLDQAEITRLIAQKTTEDEHGVFKEACPALLYSIVSNVCPKISDNTFHVHDTTPQISHNTLVWIYSMLAVVIISICGVLALVIIPVMQKKFYKPLIQFLVALAVGTLAGDALLHLLPHAMTSEHAHDAEEHSHDENTWKGFVAMLGLTFFFIMERLIMLTAKWRKNRQKSKHTHVKVVGEEEDIDAKNETQCMDRYNPSPYCYKDIMSDRNSAYLESDKTATTVLDLLGSNSDVQSLKKSRSPTIEKLRSTEHLPEYPSDDKTNNCTEMNRMLPHHESDREDYTVIVREHQSDHHGHSHKHGHVHAAPHNFSSVAWMVIMGDGLHNFTDGMAIGAAFSSGLAGGFSTTVAVFCHELPHELGDFAMLLKAGMTIRQALFYNLLSSVLCIFGNICGLWLGNTDYANSWVFAAAAGTFIYIALVDMIPELSSAHEDEENLLQCFLHLAGLLMGFGIMALIALYEHDLKHLFNE